MEKDPVTNLEISVKDGMLKITGDRELLLSLREVLNRAVSSPRAGTFTGKESGIVIEMKEGSNK